MAWSTPRTWVTNEVITSSIMNSHVRDQFNEVATVGTHRCYAYQAGGGQTVTSGNSDAITLDSDKNDPQQMHNTGANTSRVNILVTGTYFIWGTSNVTSNNAGTAALTIRNTGTALNPTAQGAFATSASNWEEQWLQCFAMEVLTAGQYIELYGTAAGTDFIFATTQLIVCGRVAVA